MTAGDARELAHRLTDLAGDPDAEDLTALQLEV